MDDSQCVAIGRCMFKSMWTPAKKVLLLLEYDQVFLFWTKNIQYNILVCKCRIYFPLVQKHPVLFPVRVVS